MAFYTCVGILGGLISSTASTIVLVRVAIEIAAVARGLLPELVPPFIAVFVLMAAISAWLYYRLQQSKARPTEHSNPSQLKPALIFGAMYALVLLLVAFIRGGPGDVSELAGAPSVDFRALTGGTVCATFVPHTDLVLS